MTSEARGKFFSRILAVLLVGLAFAASAAMMAQGERSLFVDLPETSQVSSTLADQAN